ncbi:MAG: hypothetical protein ACOX68_01165 [Candidatus Limivicinus sp.]|jgi:hypothetical protein
MRIFKKSLIFIVLNIIVACSLNFLLTNNPRPFDLRLKEYTEEPCSVVALGHSLGKSGVVPEVFNDDNPGKMFNLCNGGLSLEDFGYLIRGMNERRHLDIVYLDMYFDYWRDPDDMYFVVDTLGLDILKELPGNLKASYFANVICKRNYNSVLFPYNFSADTISSIPNNIKRKIDFYDCVIQDKNLIRQYHQKEDPTYAGCGFNSESQFKGQKCNYRTFNAEDVYEERIREFDDIVKYCDEQNIRLICFISALPTGRLQNENHDEIHNFFSDLCRSRDVELYDMNYLKYEYLPRTAENYIDADGHMKCELAERQTQLLKKITLANDKTVFFEDNYSDILQGIADYQEKN